MMGVVEDSDDADLPRVHVRFRSLGGMGASAGLKRSSFGCAEATTGGEPARSGLPMEVMVKEGLERDEGEECECDNPSEVEGEGPGSGGVSAGVVVVDAGERKVEAASAVRK